MPERLPRRRRTITVDRKNYDKPKYLQQQLLTMSVDRKFQTFAAVQPTAWSAKYFLLFAVAMDI